jgi:hypothetical protein
MSVWYSPELNIIDVHDKSDGFLFRNKQREFHWMFYYADMTKLYEFYYIGELK